MKNSQEAPEAVSKSGAILLNIVFKEDIFNYYPEDKLQDGNRIRNHPKFHHFLLGEEIV